MSSPDALFWTLRIDYPAVRLTTHAPYDTVRLTASPYSAVDAAIDTTVTEHGNTIWYSTDSTLVRVTSDGMVSARGVTGTKKIYVVARKQVGGITRSDTAMIQVVDVVNPPILVSFRSRPSDSLKRASGMSFVMIPQLLDRDSAPIAGYPVHYRSSNLFVAPIRDPWSGTVSAGFLIHSNTIGTSRIVASTMAFGVSFVDTFTVEVGYPLAPIYNPTIDVGSVNGVPISYLKIPSINIGPGGVVGFTNSTGINAERASTNPGFTPSNGTVINYIFDDSLNVKDAGPQYALTSDGNIHSIPGDTLIMPLNRRHFRKFQIPGRYEYTVEPYGFRGVVVVHDR